MSWACTHCILPSCPSSNQEGGGWGGDRGGQGWGRAPRPNWLWPLQNRQPVGCGCIATAGLRPSLWSLHEGLFGPLQLTLVRLGQPSSSLHSPLCCSESGGLLIGVFALYPKRPSRNDEVEVHLWASCSLSLLRQPRHILPTA